jgi:uncharacterized protein (DUF697 family)
MGWLSSARGVGEIWKTISEVDLHKIHEASERRFSLVVTGDPAPAEALALLLSARPGSVGIHPWVSLLPLPWAPDEPNFRPDVVLVVTEAADHDVAAQAAIRQLARRGIPVVTVVTGADALQRTGAELPREGEAERVIVPDLAATEDAAAALFRPLVELLASESHPEALLAMGRYLPVFRDESIHELIDDTARANAVYSATTGLGEMVPVLAIPLVIGDTVILTKNQLIMAYKIAVVAGKHGDPPTLMGQVASVIGGGLIARLIARELVGLIPVIGIVPKVAIAYAGTKAIGSVAHIWAVEDRRPSHAEVRSFYRTALHRGREISDQIVARARREKHDQSLPALLSDDAELTPPPAIPEAPVSGGGL